MVHGYTDAAGSTWAAFSGSVSMLIAARASMERALANPLLPAVLVPSSGSLRVEVNLADEVLVLYRGNQVELISYVLSGGGYYYCSPGGGCAYAITPTGNFTATTFMPG